MKFYIKKVLLFILPLIIIMILVDDLENKIPNDIEYKNQYLNTSLGDIETLILGSSHTFFGLNPAFFNQKTFNAANHGQDVSIDFRIIKKIIPKVKNLKSIIIPIDYGLLYYKLIEKHPERIEKYNQFFQMNYPVPFMDRLENYLFSTDDFTNILDYYIYNLDKRESSKLGFYNKKIVEIDLNKSLKREVERHNSYKNENYFIENFNTIENCLKTAEKHGVNMIFISTPLHKTYIERINKLQFSKTKQKIKILLKKYKKGHVYIDYSENENFEDEDFKDVDHLNFQGATKLSKMVNSIIEE